MNHGSMIWRAHGTRDDRRDERVPGATERALSDLDGADTLDEAVARVTQAYNALQMR